MLNHARIARQLRRRLDGEDPFHHGHQIIQERRVSKKMPEWTKSDHKIQALLLRSFPQLKESTTHRLRAARWATVIHLYFRIGLTYGQVAEEMDLTPKQVADILLRINRVSRGEKANGTGVLTARRGRPRKSCGSRNPI